MGVTRDIAFLSWVEYIAVLLFSPPWQGHGNAMSLQMYRTQFLFPSLWLGMPTMRLCLILFDTLSEAELSSPSVPSQKGTRINFLADCILY
ncbi:MULTISPECIES: hypothetical protein [Cyanophyceae]|uniref:hypothetical protein n=1 Tax=Cyanophyceae TaxID=3028117 RepID=UPI001684724D|nr:hypothetical protein [Trichocoleus sp. FACHB-40]